jgi:hypothetical protein
VPLMIIGSSVEMRNKIRYVQTRIEKFAHRWASLTLLPGPGKIFKANIIKVSWADWNQNSVTLQTPSMKSAQVLPQIFHCLLIFSVALAEIRPQILICWLIFAAASRKFCPLATVNSGTKQRLIS